MEKKDVIYVAGHKGLVGSAIFDLLKNKGFENIIVKDSNELDLRNQKDGNDFLDLTSTKTSLSGESIEINTGLGNDIVWSSDGNETIDLGDGAFATGQAYVALSRCKTLNSLMLLREGTVSDGLGDPDIQDFHSRHFN